MLTTFKSTNKDTMKLLYAVSLQICTFMLYEMCRFFITELLHHRYGIPKSLSYPNYDTNVVDWVCSIYVTNGPCFYIIGVWERFFLHAHTDSLVNCCHGLRGALCSHLFSERNVWGVLLQRESSELFAFPSSMAASCGDLWSPRINRSKRYHSIFKKNTYFFFRVECCLLENYMSGRWCKGFYFQDIYIYH